jgi:hypothetical protein
VLLWPLGHATVGEITRAGAQQRNRTASGSIPALALCRSPRPEGWPAGRARSPGPTGTRTRAPARPRVPGARYQTGILPNSAGAQAARARGARRSRDGPLWSLPGYPAVTVNGPEIPPTVDSIQMVRGLVAGAAAFVCRRLNTGGWTGGHRRPPEHRACEAALMDGDGGAHHRPARLPGR